MTCTCHPLSAFRWSEWPRDESGWLKTEDLARRLRDSSSATINNARASGVDLAHIGGMASSAAQDPRRYVVERRREGLSA